MNQLITLHLKFERKARIPIDADLESVCELLRFLPKLDFVVFYFVIFSSAKEPNTANHMEHMEKSTDTKVAVCKFLDFIPRYVP